MIKNYVKNSSSTLDLEINIDNEIYSHGEYVLTSRCDVSRDHKNIFYLRDGKA